MASEQQLIVKTDMHVVFILFLFPADGCHFYQSFWLMNLHFVLLLFLAFVLLLLISTRVAESRD